MPDNNIFSNKRIAKNTILLYLRLILLLVVTLYTSRVVLATLGIDDYGLYNVVGGVVTMFTFLNSAMANSSNRFITYALGKGNEKELHDTVCSTCVIHWIIAGIILILAETIGLWFLNNKMVIPESRLLACNWVYQFSIIACIVTIISVPYNAMIIAHEKMATFAFISILDAGLKLLIVFLIQLSNSDKLILYAGLILCVNIIIRFIYQLYCRRNFEEAKNIKYKRLPELKSIASFAGWSLIGNLAYIGYTQGLNILLNLFFGPAVNAARGVAVQVQSAVKAFVGNFQTAINPQIVKSYATNDLSRMHNLVFASSKFSYYLLLCMVLPLSIEAENILGIWLKEVPDYSVVFTILTLCITLVEPLSNPIGVANNATGDIRLYQIVEGGSLLMIVPIAYIILRCGGAPISVFIVQLVIMYLVQLVRIFLVCNKIGMSKRTYITRVLLRVVVVTITSSIIPLLCYYYMPETILSGISIVLISILNVIICAYLFGLNTFERNLINAKMISYMHRFQKLSLSK